MDVSGWLENRVTTIDPPGRESQYCGALEYAAWQLDPDGVRFERQLDPHTALTITAVWRCVNYIASSISCLGWNVFERRDNGRERVPVYDDISWILDTQANPEMSAFEFRQILLKDALTWRGGYAEIERDGFGRVRWLWRLDPSRLDFDRMQSGQLVYVVDNGPGQRSTILLPEQVFHVKGLGPDGIVGYSPIEMANRTLKLGRLQETFSQSFFERGPMPGAVLEVQGANTLEKRQEIREQVERTYGGAKNRGRVYVLRTGDKFTPLTLPNDEAQLIEQRRYSVEDIARIYGVPLHKLADLTHATFSNIEHQAIEAVQDCLLPWCRRLETEADIKLYGQVNRGRRFTKLNLASLLRGDTVSQTEAIVKQVNGGLRTLNEGRSMLDLNPIPGGDTLIVQGAMITLDTLLNPPKPANPNPNPNQDNPNPNQDNPNPPNNPNSDMQNLSVAFLPLLKDSFERLLRVDADKAKRAANKGKLVDHVQSFYVDESAERDSAIAFALSPVVSALLVAMGSRANPADLSKEMAARVRAVVTDAAKSGELENYAGLAERLATAELETILDKLK